MSDTTVSSPLIIFFHTYCLSLSLSRHLLLFPPPLRPLFPLCSFFGPFVAGGTRSWGNFSTVDAAHHMCPRLLWVQVGRLMSSTAWLMSSTIVTQQFCFVGSTMAFLQRFGGHDAGRQRRGTFRRSDDVAASPLHLPPSSPSLHLYLFLASSHYHLTLFFDAISSPVLPRLLFLAPLFFVRKSTGTVPRTPTHETSTSHRASFCR